MEKIDVPSFLTEDMVVQPELRSSCVLLVTCSYSCEGCYACESEGCGSCVACEGCEWHCSSCYSCQSCDSCQNCNSCNTCQGCDAAQGCGDRQGFPHLPTINSVTITGIGTNYIDATINASNGKYYRAIARPTDSGHADVDTGYLTTNVFRIPGLAANRTYNVTFFAYNSAKDDWDSKLEYVTTAALGKLPKPTVSVIKTTSNVVEFSVSNYGAASQIRSEVILKSAIVWDYAKVNTFPTSQSSYRVEGLTPSTQYQIRVKGQIDYTTGWTESDYSTIVYFTTAARPNLFSWLVTPTKGNPFSKSITRSKWIELQDTVNAWRYEQGLSMYQIRTDASELETVFTRPPSVGSQFKSFYFNQVVQAMSGLSGLGFILPTKKTKKQVCTAADFLRLQDCINSLYK